MKGRTEEGIFEEEEEEEEEVIWKGERTTMTTTWMQYIWDRSSLVI